MTTYEEDIRRQMTRFVRKRKTSSDIGYPATAEVMNISAYDIIQRNQNIYKVSIRYLVVAAVETAMFEDVFMMELSADGPIRVLDLRH